MVGLFKALLPPLLFATFAAAQLPTSENLFNITNPSSTSWWVANSTNVMAWDCQSTAAIAVNNFTALISNENSTLGALAFTAIQANDDCSVTITQSQVDKPPGSNYLILFANPINNSEVYTVSQPFTIEPLGSMYPSQVTSSASAGSGTGTASPSASASSSSGAALNSNSLSFGLAGIMGLLTVGLLGA